MDRATRLRVVGLVAVVVVVAIAVILLYAVGVLVPKTSAVAPGPLPRTYVNLTITYDPSSGIANYSTPFISMVAHTLIVVTITSHDPTASSLFVPWDNHVIGTVGGNETINCGSGPRTVSVLPANDIAHTFTVLDSYYNVSVPIPPATSASVPCVVTFQLELNYSEMTTWGCVANCDNGQMAAGRMWGLLLISG